MVLLCVFNTCIVGNAYFLGESTVILSLSTVPSGEVRWRGF